MYALICAIWLKGGADLQEHNLHVSLKQELEKWQPSAGRPNVEPVSLSFERHWVELLSSGDMSHGRLVSQSLA